MSEVKGCQNIFASALFPIADHDISLNIVQERSWNSQERLRLKQKDSSQKREGASVAVPKLTVSKFHKYSLASIEYPHEGCTYTSIFTKKKTKNCWTYLGYTEFLNITKTPFHQSLLLNRKATVEKKKLIVKKNNN